MINNEWINVKDKLPEINILVKTLVRYANSDNEHEEKMIGYYEDGTPEWEYHATNCVTHWRPII